MSRTRIYALSVLRFVGTWLHVYSLLDTDCDPGPCESEAIDAGDNADINCGGGDLYETNNRCVDVEGNGAINDMGCLEIQE